MICPTAQFGCFVKEGYVPTAGGVANFESFQTNATAVACSATWGDLISCPDGIGPRGVFVTDGWTAADAGAPVDTQVNFCVSWAYIGTMFQRCTPDGLVCTKAQILHAHHGSRSAGTLVMKRTVCDDAGKCSVFKVGRCFEFGMNIWSSVWNHDLSDMLGEARAFGEAAVNVLESEGASTSCSSDWCPFVGTFDLTYSNSHRNTITIEETRAVTSSSPPATTQLVISHDVDCPGSPCARIEMYGEGSYDLLAVSATGDLLLKNFYSSTSFCCTGNVTRSTAKCSHKEEQLSKRDMMTA